MLKNKGKREKLIEMIKVVIKNGLDNNIISMLTGLSVLEVEELRKELLLIIIKIITS